MALTYYHSSKTGPGISFDISTIDGSNFHSNKRSVPLLLSPSLTPFFSSHHILLFSDFPLLATSRYQSLLPTVSTLSVSPLHLLPFCSFLAIKHFFQPIFCYINVSLNGYFFHLFVVPHVLNRLSFSLCLFMHCLNIFFPQSAKPFHLSLSVLALSPDPSFLI